MKLRSIRDRSIGPFVLDALVLRLAAPTDGSGDLSLVVGASLSGELGPVTVSVENIGFHVDATFASGNMGPFDLDLGFKPPTGAGLAIDASVVVGGGFLRFDAEKEEYSGILQLEIAEKIAVKAIGMLTTTNARTAPRATR